MISWSNHELGRVDLGGHVDPLAHVVAVANRDVVTNKRHSVTTTLREFLLPDQVRVQFEQYLKLNHHIEDIFDYFPILVDLL